MQVQTVKGLEIVPPKTTAGQVETAPHLPKLPMVLISCGKRQSGKTTSLVSLLEKLPFHRIFWVGSTIKSNKALIKKLNIAEEDMFEDTDDLTLIDRIKEEVQKEADDLVRYEEEMRRYNKLMKMINSSVPLFQADDLMTEFYSNGDFMKPRHRWNGERCVMGCVYDDCLGAGIYSKPRKLNNLTTLSRHLGTFEDGRPSLGLSLYFLIQSLKCQSGGLTKTIRNQATQYIMFKSHNEKELQDLAESVSGEVPPETFHKVMGAALQERHDFLFIDLNFKKEHQIFRRNFNQFLIPSCKL